MSFDKVTEEIRCTQCAREWKWLEDVESEDGCKCDTSAKATMCPAGVMMTVDEKPEKNKCEF